MARIRALGGMALLALVLAATGCSGGPPPPEQVARPATIQRGELKFVESYDQGIQLAQQEGKPLLLFFTAAWCNFCHQLAADAFKHEQVVGLSDQFVCVLVDADSQPEICRHYHVRSFPTIQFLSPRGVPLNRMTGKRPGTQLVMEMQSALQATARRADPARHTTLR
ncbi:MAG: thioredoxin family protein [Pirellulales bacterium]|nr:thioredoxin family protein [Pirellulales bacterium]